MKKSKKLIFAGLIAAVMVLSSMITFAQSFYQEIYVQFNSVILKVNGQVVDADNLIYKGTIYVPLRDTANALGTTVSWDQVTRTASISSYPSSGTSNSILKLQDVSNDKIRNGIDQYIWPDGTIYQGEWKNNKVNGKGTIIFSNDDKYIGEFVSNQREGTGIYKWSNGESYAGYWSNDMMIGKGTYTFLNGDKYVGEWDNSKMNGQGTYTYKDGTVLSGKWKDNKYQGQ